MSSRIRNFAFAAKAKYIFGAAALLVLCAFPFISSGNIMTVLTLILIYISMGQMWNLMGGYAGLLSLGMQAFIGIGGYSLAVLSVNYGFGVYLSIVVGAAVSVVFALAISPALFKMSGVYFAIGSWVVAEALIIWFSNWAFVKYAQGIGISTVYGISPTQIYYTALALGIGSVLVVFLLMRSKTGLALMSMRDSASSAETMGVKLYNTKLKCYLIAAFITGLAGGVMYMQQGYIIPSSGFGISWTVAMTFMVIIGGMGTMEGPIIGAVLYVLLTQYLYNFPGISMIILGIVAVAVILIAPKGIMGMLNEKTGIEILSPRRALN
jgi:branched-chain amino acid transport system permease protein